MLDLNKLKEVTLLDVFNDPIKYELQLQFVAAHSRFRISEMMIIESMKIEEDQTREIFDEIENSVKCRKKSITVTQILNEEIGKGLNHTKIRVILHNFGVKRLSDESKKSHVEYDKDHAVQAMTDFWKTSILSGYDDDGNMKFSNAKYGNFKIYKSCSSIFIENAANSAIYQKDQTNDCS